MSDPDDDETVFAAVRDYAESKLIEAMSYVTYRAFIAGWRAARSTEVEDYDMANAECAWDRWLDTERVEGGFHV